MSRARRFAEAAALYHELLRTAPNSRSAREALVLRGELLSERLRKPPKRKSRLGRFILFGLVAAGIALVLSEDARKTVLDTLFGAEEEFEYTSTTSINGS